MGRSDIDHQVDSVELDADRGVCIQPEELSG